MFVHPWGRIAQVDVEPSLGGTFPAAPEGDLQVHLSMIVAQCQPDVREDLVLISSRGIEIPEQASVRRDAKLALAQHAEVAER
jgi:hypothetical protein